MTANTIYQSQNTILSRQFITDNVLPAAFHESHIPTLEREGMLYVRMFDLAITYYVPLKRQKIAAGGVFSITDSGIPGRCFGNGTMLFLSSDMAKDNYLTPDDVSDAASKNMWSNFLLTPMIDVLNAMDVHRRYQLMGLPMYVATTRSGLYGAGIISSSHALGMIAERFGAFYLLPTSIHECCVIPYSSTLSQHELYDIISEINAAYTPVSEQLTDNVYLVHENGNIESYI